MHFFSQVINVLHGFSPENHKRMVINRPQVSSECGSDNDLERSFFNPDRALHQRNAGRMAAWYWQQGKEEQMRADEHTEDGISSDSIAGEPEEPKVENFLDRVFARAADPDVLVRVALARDETAPAAAMWVLLDDKSPMVRLAMAANTHCPMAVLERLCKDRDPWVRHGARKALKSIFESSEPNKFAKAV